jgi:hypothetical protein
MAGSHRAQFPPPTTPHRRTTSPNKRQRALDDVFGDVDDDTTPRPPQAMLPPLPLPLPPQSPVAGSGSSPSRSSGLSSPTKASGHQSRTSSSSKSLAAYAHAPITIQKKGFARPGQDGALPPALADMVKVISRQHARGIRVVSSSLRVSFAEPLFSCALNFLCPKALVKWPDLSVLKLTRGAGV